MTEPREVDPLLASDARVLPTRGSTFCMCVCVPAVLEALSPALSLYRSCVAILSYRTESVTHDPLSPILLSLSTVSVCTRRAPLFVLSRFLVQDPRGLVSFLRIHAYNRNNVVQ